MMSEKTDDELSEMLDSIANARLCPMFQREILREAAARLRQQSEDSARLDFLEELKDGSINYNGLRWVFSIPGTDPPYLWSYPGGNTFREAIDKARKA